MKSIFEGKFQRSTIIFFGILLELAVVLAACGTSSNMDSNKEEKELAADEQDLSDDSDQEYIEESDDNGAEEEFENDEIVDFGSWEASFADSMDDISFSDDYTEVTVCFTLTNLDDYEKQPKEYFVLSAMQDYQELDLRSGDLEESIPALQKKKYYITYALVSDNPIVFRVMDVEENVWSESTISVGD